jgi:hypothetical protein
MNWLSASLPERSSIVHTLSYSVVDLLLCAGNFIFARQPARPLLPASGFSFPLLRPTRLDILGVQPDAMARQFLACANGWGADLKSQAEEETSQTKSEAIILRFNLA